MALSAATLTSSEFIPAALISPIARDFGLMEGQIGQAMAASGVMAVITSLSIARLTRTLDVQKVILVMVVLAALASVLIATATDLSLFIVGRMILGTAVGGFWGLQAATVIAITPGPMVPRSFAIINAGSAMSGVLAAPFVTAMEQVTNWRMAYLVFVLPLVVLAGVLTLARLPKMPPDASRPLPANPLKLLAIPLMALGIAAIALQFMGIMSLQSYFRPFLEKVTAVPPQSLAFYLFLPGAFGLLGSFVAQYLLATRLYSVIIGIPMGLFVIILAFLIWGGLPLAVGVLIAIWGMVATAAPIGWYTWLARVLPEQAASAGGLQIAAIQGAIYIGVAIGGGLFDSMGWQATWSFSAILMLLAALLAFIAMRLGEKKGV